MKNRVGGICVSCSGKKESIAKIANSEARDALKVCCKVAYV